MTCSPHIARKTASIFMQVLSRPRRRRRWFLCPTFSAAGCIFSHISIVYDYLFGLLISHYEVPLKSLCPWDELEDVCMSTLSLQMSVIERYGVELRNNLASQTVMQATLLRVRWPLCRPHGRCSCSTLPRGNIITNNLWKQVGRLAVQQHLDEPRCMN